MSIDVFEEAVRTLIAEEVKKQVAQLRASLDAIQAVLAKTGDAQPVSQPATKQVAEPAQITPVAQTEGEAPAPAVSYADVVQPLIRKYTPTAKKLVLEILAKYGAKTGPELKPADYPAVVKALKAIGGGK